MFGGNPSLWEHHLATVKHGGGSIMLRDLELEAQTIKLTIYANILPRFLMISLKLIKVGNAQQWRLNPLVRKLTVEYFFSSEAGRCVFVPCEYVMLLSCTSTLRYAWFSNCCPDIPATTHCIENEGWVSDCRLMWVPGRISDNDIKYKYW